MAVSSTKKTISVALNFIWGPNSSMEDFGSRRGWNDEISSAWATSNCSIMLYEDSRFPRRRCGWSTLKMTQLKNINGGFNDKTSLGPLPVFVMQPQA